MQIQCNNTFIEKKKMDTVQLTIDNQTVVVKKGITILEAAKGMGVHIPTLCHMKLDDLNIENKPGG